MVANRQVGGVEGEAVPCLKNGGLGLKKDHTWNELNWDVLGKLKKKSQRKAMINDFYFCNNKNNPQTNPIQIPPQGMI